MKTMCIFIVLVEHIRFERAEKQPLFKHKTLKILQLLLAIIPKYWNFCFIVTEDTATDSKGILILLLWWKAIREKENPLLN